MSTIKELQEALPFFVNLPPVPKVILSAVLLGLTAFILALIWTPPPPPPDTAVTEILNKCYRRALFTRMHAQQSLPAMYASIDQCREAVQIGIPSIRSKERRAIAIELLATLEAIGRYSTKPITDGDAAKINDLKRAALGYFRKLAESMGTEYVLPEPGKLGETSYFTVDEAEKPPSPQELMRATDLP
jgi:hypothetical protein